MTKNTIATRRLRIPLAAAKWTLGLLLCGCSQGGSSTPPPAMIEPPKQDLTVADAKVQDAAPIDASMGCAPSLPAGFPDTFSLYTHNPIVVPTSAAAVQGADNVYAPDVHDFAGVRIMWYGGQGSDGHDRIFLAWSQDGMQWRKWPTDSAPQAVLDAGTSNHVNDPSVVQSGATWRMYYTDAATAENDEIWLAESAKLTGFTKVQQVLGKGSPGAWDDEKVGRPSVLLEGGVYRMWYDGTSKGQRHVGLGTSTDGIHFTRAPQNPLLRNAGAVDVKRIGSTYVMLYEGRDGTYYATSPDGICWVDHGKLFGTSGAAYDRYGQVTPFLELEGTTIRAIWFGGASVTSWNKNRIAAAFPSTSKPTGGGCTACVTSGISCSAACISAGLGGAGVCSYPGSTSVGMCCGCQPSGCEGCTAKGDCQAACVAAKKAGGYCAFPGSTSSARCCACME